MASPRDEFTKDIARALQERVGNRCSNPSCKCLTSGPNIHPEKASRIGVAAHITAAASGGPRFDPSLTSNERSSIQNGIWLCQNCGRLVDVDSRRYTTQVLREWRQSAEGGAQTELEGGRFLPRTQPANKGRSDARIWACPHCSTEVRDGLSVCIGCKADVVYGATQQEAETCFKIGLASGGIPAAALVYWLRFWLKSPLEARTMFGLGFSIYSVLPVALCAVATAWAVTQYGNSRRRRHPPRFIRYTKI